MLNSECREGYVLPTGVVSTLQVAIVIAHSIEIVDKWRRTLMHARL